MVYDKGLFAPGWWQSGRELLVHMQHAVLPPRCVACGNGHGWRVSRVAAGLCEICQAQLPINTCACRTCALPLSGTQSGLLCGRCLRTPPPYQASWCAYEYVYPIPHLVRRLKYGGALAPSRVLGNLLARYLQAHRAGAWPECFIPVPLHSRRYRTRGYNQVIELGRWLERTLNIPMRTDLVIRRRHTPEQAGLSRRERRKNLRRAFVTTDVAPPRHIALLDDVITTGSTMNELARLLKQSGVEHIEVWGLARASMNMKKST